MPVTQEGLMYCVWEVKDGISESDFQEFIDRPEGVNMRMKSINNNLLKIDLELTSGQLLMKGSLHKSVFSIIEKYMRGQ